MGQLHLHIQVIHCKPLFNHLNFIVIGIFKIILVFLDMNFLTDSLLTNVCNQLIEISFTQAVLIPAVNLL